MAANQIAVKGRTQRDVVGVVFRWRYRSRLSRESVMNILTIAVSAFHLLISLHSLRYEIWLRTSDLRGFK